MLDAIWSWAAGKMKSCEGEEFNGPFLGNIFWPLMCGRAGR
jgi:hypothetical protein